MKQTFGETSKTSKTKNQEKKFKKNLRIKLGGNILGTRIQKQKIWKAKLKIKLGRQRFLNELLDNEKSDEAILEAKLDT